MSGAGLTLSAGEQLLCRVPRRLRVAAPGARAHAALGLRAVEGERLHAPSRLAEGPTVPDLNYVCCC